MRSSQFSEYKGSASGLKAVQEAINDAIADTAFETIIDENYLYIFICIVCLVMSTLVKHAHAHIHAFCLVVTNIPLLFRRSQHEFSAGLGLFQWL